MDIDLKTIINDFKEHCGRTRTSYRVEHNKAVFNMMIFEVTTQLGLIRCSELPNNKFKLWFFPRCTKDLQNVPEELEYKLTEIQYNQLKTFYYS